ncbi:MAG: hypothetical protein GY719_28345 [bacterium]|nr:hypothetical protein [bacterium]
MTLRTGEQRPAPFAAEPEARPADGALLGHVLDLHRLELLGLRHGHEVVEDMVVLVDRPSDG